MRRHWIVGQQFEITCLRLEVKELCLGHEYWFQSNRATLFIGEICCWYKSKQVNRHPELLSKISSFENHLQDNWSQR